MPRLSSSLATAAGLCAAASMLLPLGPLLSVSALAADDWTPVKAQRVGYPVDPLWRDEFDGGILDKTKWDAKDVAWPDNEELQYYSPNAPYVQVSPDSKLEITATEDHTGGRSYTSARIDTSKSVQFKHGLFAARIRLTKGQGLWPAWWMFGTGAKYSEIDIAELVGGSSATTSPPTGSGDDSTYGCLTHFSVKDRPTPEVTMGPGTIFKAPAGEKFADDYHVMWLEWTEHAVYAGLDTSWQKIVDDISQLEAFQAHMYLILNLAVGGSFPGKPDATTIFPATMSVDWVRVWAKDGEDIMLLTPAPPEPTTVPAGSTSSSSSSSDSSSSSSSTTTTTVPAGNTEGTTPPPTTSGSTVTPAPDTTVSSTPTSSGGEVTVVTHPDGSKTTTTSNADGTSSVVESPAPAEGGLGGSGGGAGGSAPGGNEYNGGSTTTTQQQPKSTSPASEDAKHVSAASAKHVGIGAIVAAAVGYMAMLL